MTDKKYAPTITAMFETKSGNYISRSLDEAGVEEVATALNIDSSSEFVGNLLGRAFFLRKSRNPNATGRHTYFLDLVNPAEFQTSMPTNDLG